MKKEIFVRWKLTPSETERILRLLPELAEKSRSEKGNLSYAIYQSEADPNELILHESYADAGAAETHKQSAHYREIVANAIIPHLQAREVISVQRLQ